MFRVNSDHGWRDCFLGVWCDLPSRGCLLIFRSEFLRLPITFQGLQLSRSGEQGAGSLHSTLSWLPLREIEDRVFCSDSSSIDVIHLYLNNHDESH